MVKISLKHDLSFVYKIDVSAQLLEMLFFYLLKNGSVKCAISSWFIKSY